MNEVIAEGVAKSMEMGFKGITKVPRDITQRVLSEKASAIRKDFIEKITVKYAGMTVTHKVRPIMRMHMCPSNLQPFVPGLTPETVK